MHSALKDIKAAFAGLGEEGSTAITTIGCTAVRV